MEREPADRACRCRRDANTARSSRRAPCASSTRSQLRREVFGPILHVVRYAAERLDAVLDAIDATGYGLTLGVHSRIETMQRRIVGALRVGNAYVNRNQIGAVVGVQPFGGERPVGHRAEGRRPDYARTASPRSAWSASTPPRKAGTPRLCRSRRRTETIRSALLPLALVLRLAGGVGPCTRRSAGAGRLRASARQPRGCGGRTLRPRTPALRA